MAEVTTNFRDSNQGDLGKNLVSKEYLQAVFPKLAAQLFTSTLWGSSFVNSSWVGNNTNANSTPTAPLFTYAPKNDWIYASLGSMSPETALAINADGTLWISGNLRPSTGGFTYRSTPTQVGVRNDWKSVSHSEQSLIGIVGNGLLQVLGNNNNFQRTAVGGSVTISNWKAVAHVSGNDIPLAAIRSDGSLWTWGSNLGYALGRNYSPSYGIPANKASTSTMSQISLSGTWKKVCITSQSSSGVDEVCVNALKTDGTMWSWGYNGNYGAASGINGLKFNMRTPVPFPYINTNWRTVPTTLASIDPTSFPSICVSNSAHYIKNDGSVWGWGDNRLGSYLVNNFSSVKPYSPRRELTSSTNWKQIERCREQSASAQLYAGLKTDGTLWFWGANYNTYFSGYNILASPRQEASSSTNWKQIAVDQINGQFSSRITALKTNGTIWFFGRSHSQYLSSISSTPFTPRQELGLVNNWTSVYAGQGITVAIKSDGSLWSWGGSGVGSILLGNNTSSPSDTPVREATSSTNWKQVSARSGTTVALKTDGTVWGWGTLSGWYGSNSRNASSPIQEFSSTTNWRMIQFSGSHYYGIKQDGTLWSWGSNSYGQLGVNDLILRSTPVQEFTSSTNWNYICKSLEGITLAVKNDGTLWGWGNNRHSTLGIESGFYYITPVPEITRSKWNDIASSSPTFDNRISNIGIKQDGTLWIWGGGPTSTPKNIGQGKSWKSCSISDGSDDYQALSTDGSLLFGSTGISDIVFLAKNSGAGTYMTIRNTP